MNYTPNDGRITYENEGFITVQELIDSA